jgi:non-specific serine/threonine protein kinase
MPSFSPDTLSEERLQKAVSPEVYASGLHLFEAGKTKVVQSTGRSATCIVQERRQLHVKVKLTSSHLVFECSCPTGSRGLICEHAVASWLAIAKHLRVNVFPQWRTQVNQVMDALQMVPQRTNRSAYFLFFSLQPPSSTGYPSWKIIPYYLPLNSLPQSLLSQLDAKDSAAVSNLIPGHPAIIQRLKTVYHPLDFQGCVNCRLEGVLLANILVERDRGLVAGIHSNLDEFLRLASSSRLPLFKGIPGNPLHEPLRVLDQPGSINLHIDRDDSGIRMYARLSVGGTDLDVKSETVEVLHPAPIWLLAGGDVFQLVNDLEGELLSSLWHNPEIHIPPEHETDFLNRYYLKLAQVVPLQGNAVVRECLDLPPVARCYLGDESQELLVQLRFSYGDLEIPYDPGLPDASIHHLDGTWKLISVRRHPVVEKACFDLLASSRFGLKRAPIPGKPGVFRLRARVHLVDFLLNTLPRLKDAGFEIIGEEQLKIARINRNKPQISFAVASGIDWFDLHAVINFGELEVSLKEIRRAMRKKERFIKLPDGSIGEIPSEWFDQYHHLFSLGELDGDRIRFSPHHLGLIDEAISKADKVQTDIEFQRRRERIRLLLEGGFKGVVSQQLPADFSGELRPYQKAGYDWLHFLHEFEFGGCLADDMGLGKTIQTLVFLQSLYLNPDTSQRPTQASLLVVPRSLLVNWQREAERFTPGLRVYEHFQTNRTGDVGDFEQADLIITTYGVMLRDIQLLHRYTFYYAILDESQAIKNPRAQTSRTAHLLNARHRLVLTGTPIENSTLELWSQFSFINPGFLGSLDFFTKEFASPIEKQADNAAASRLRKLVYPFILRRTKDQVAPELPPRTERILYCDMEPAQRKFYNRTRDVYRGLLLGMLENEGLTRSRMKILEGLLRLRQIANHPLLVDDKFRGSSAKFDLLTDTINTLLSENHKALIFSQFVRMLSLVRKELDDRQILYAYLDGHTVHRQRRVDEFQSDPDLPFFLISLRAGGLGLNLTAADYVIHIDPWWNPAVEMQASDRTHRIGQDKPVFIYKLIARDTVEEKILLLQERKKYLIEQLVTTEKGFLKSLSEEDVKVLFS